MSQDEPSNERPTEWPAQVRVSQFPDKVLEVDESEWTNLHHQGLIVENVVKPKVTNQRKTSEKE